MNRTASMLVDYGLDVAVFRNQDQIALPDIGSPRCQTMSTVPTSPWRMNKAELTRELDALQIPIHRRWTLPELRQTVIEHRQQRTGEEETAIKGLGRMTLDELKAKCTEHSLKVPTKATRGLLIKMLRHASQPSGDLGDELRQVQVMDVQGGAGGLPPLGGLGVGGERHGGGRSLPLCGMGKGGAGEAVDICTEVRGCSYNMDPEARAITPVPKVAVSSAPCSSWSRVSSRGTPKRASSETESGVSAMDAELPEEAQAELLRLETEIALAKQKYRVSGRVPPASPGDVPRE